MNLCLMATLGGVLIGASAVLRMASPGRIAGISGIISGLLAGAAGDRSWRRAFLAGNRCLHAVRHGDRLGRTAFFAGLHG